MCVCVCFFACLFSSSGCALARLFRVVLSGAFQRSPATNRLAPINHHWLHWRSSLSGHQLLQHGDQSCWLVTALDIDCSGAWQPWHVATLALDLLAYFSTLLGGYDVRFSLYSLSSHHLVVATYPHSCASIYSAPGQQDFTTSRGVWCSYSRCLLTPYVTWNYFLLILPTNVDAVCKCATMPAEPMRSI